MSELSNPSDFIYESQLDTQSPAYLADYQQVQGVTVLPISVYLEMALAAAGDALGQGPYALLDVDFLQLLFLPEASPRTVRIVISPKGPNEATFQILSLSLDSERREQDRWNLYSSGRIQRREVEKESSTKGSVRLEAASRVAHATQFSLSYFGSSEATFTPVRYQLLIDGAKFADRHGYTAVWTPERHFNSFGGSYPAPAILSAALSTITERVHLRAGSVILPLHHPVRIAEEWSVIDNLSQGRIGISVATGWSADDFVLRPENFEERREVMFRSLEVLKKFWRGETLFLTGGSGKPTPIKLFPMPKQPELPVWITVVKNPDMYERAGEIGANVLTNLLSQTSEDLARNIKLYRDSLTRHGYDPTAGHVTLLVHTFIGEDLDRVRNTVRKPFCDYLKSTVGIIQNLITSLDLKLDLKSLTAKDMDDLLTYAFERYFQANALMGTPAMALDRIACFEEIGVDEIACFVDFGVEPRLVMESLSLLNQVRERSAMTSHRSPTVKLDRDFLTSAQARCVESISGTVHYQKLRERGMDFGPSFRGVLNTWKGEAEAVGELDLPVILEANAEAYEFHPALLDAGLQLLMTILPASEDERVETRTFVPVGTGEMCVYAKPEMKIWAHVCLRPAKGGSSELLIGDLRMFDQRGKLIAECLGVRLQALEATIPAPAGLRFEDLLYKLEWEPVARELNEDKRERLPRQNGAWLIFADDGGLGQELSALLSKDGQTSISISQGQSYSASKQKHFFVNPQNAEDFEALLRNVSEYAPKPLLGIVHLWSLDAATPDKTTAPTLERAQALGCESVMHLVQGLTKHHWPQPPQLWMVTRGAQHTGGEDAAVSIAQSPIWGLGRVIRIEHPELRCTTIDLDPGNALHSPEFLLDELYSNNKEDQVALRGKTRYAPRLTRCTKNSWPEKLTPHYEQEPSARVLVASSTDSSIMASDTWPNKTGVPGFDPGGAAPLREDTGLTNPKASALFRQDSTYLITGGFGVLGLILARHMVSEGARHLVLMGRSGSSSTSDEVLDELRGSGAEICEIKCDVTKEKDVARVLAQIQEVMPPLRGIIHAAMWIEDSVLLQLDRERFDAVVKPKVLGAWNLHSLTRDLPLDFFVLFSSAASLLGSAGQANYVAANAFLDALSHYRNFLGLPSLTIDWGQWAETHLQSRKGLAERMALIGMTPLLPEQGLGALDWLLQRQCTEVMVISADWARVSRSYPSSSQPALLSRLCPRHAKDIKASDVSSEGAEPGRKQIFAVALDGRLAWLESHILSLVGKVLQLDPVQIDPRQPLNTFGLDSLMAIEIKNEIETSLGVSLPLVRFLEGPDVGQLAVQVLAQLSPLAEQDESERLATLLKQVTELSDEEAREMLAREKASARS